MNRSVSLEGAALGAFPSQVAILDADGTIVYTNQAWEEFGAENGMQTDSIGMNYLNVCDSDEEIREAGDGIRAVISGERESFEHEYPCHSPNERRWFMMRAVPFDRGDTAYVLVMHMNITERKLAEEAVADRNERLKTVASVLSHDIRNPLTVAMGELDLLATENDSTHVSSLRHALDRIGSIVEDSLVFLRRNEIDLGPVDLGAAVRTAWAAVDTEDATLAIDDAPTVRADSAVVSHLLENLISNAVQHGGDDVTVRVGRIDEADGTNGFFVADDGPGIPESERDKVFDYGYTTAGSGLGLAIVDRTAKMHDWSVSVTESESDGNSAVEERAGDSAKGRNDGETGESGGSESRRDDRSGGARFEVTDVEMIE